MCITTIALIFLGAIVCRVIPILPTDAAIHDDPPNVASSSNDSIIPKFDSVSIDSRVVRDAAHTEASARIRSMNHGKEGIAHKERHHRRLQENSQCSTACPNDYSEADCTCRSFIKCSLEMSKYDYHVALTKGYIDTQRNSPTFGELNLVPHLGEEMDFPLYGWHREKEYDFRKIGLLPQYGGDPWLDKLGEVVVDCTDDTLSEEIFSLRCTPTCNHLLPFYYTACDPTLHACDNKKINTKTYPLTVENVCASVNTPVKLSFESIFKLNAQMFKTRLTPKVKPYMVSPPYLSPCKESDNASFSSCSEFILLFHQLYQLRDKTLYPEPNPMGDFPGFEDLPNPIVADFKVFQSVKYPIKMIPKIYTDGTIIYSGWWYPLGRRDEPVWQWEGTKITYEYSPINDYDNYNSYEWIMESCDPLRFGEFGSNALENVIQRCDASMSFLTGLTSLGTLKDIVQSMIINGTQAMPGKCCLDRPANGIFRNLPSGFIYEYNENTIKVLAPTSGFGKTWNGKYSCNNRGPWHLGISSEVCEQAGGVWIRSPCNILHQCLNDYPKIGDPGYSSTFDKFASKYPVENPNNITQCENARTHLGHGKDEQDDIVVCDTFKERMCGDLFDSVDASEEAIIPPSFRNLVYKETTFPLNPEIPVFPLESSPKITIQDWDGSIALNKSEQDAFVTRKGSDEYVVLSQTVLDIQKEICDLFDSVFVEELKIACEAELATMTMIQRILAMVLSAVAFAFEYVFISHSQNMPIYSKLNYENLIASMTWQDKALNDLNKNSHSYTQQASNDIMTRVDTLYNGSNKFNTCLTNFIIDTIMSKLGAKTDDWLVTECDAETIDSRRLQMVNTMKYQWPGGKDVHTLLREVLSGQKLIGSDIYKLHNKYNTDHIVNPKMKGIKKKSSKQNEMFDRDIFRKLSNNDNTFDINAIEEKLKDIVEMNDFIKEKMISYEEMIKEKMISYEEMIEDMNVKLNKIVDMIEV